MAMHVSFAAARPAVDPALRRGRGSWGRVAGRRATRLPRRPCRRGRAPNATPRRRTSLDLQAHPRRRVRRGRRRARRLVRGIGGPAGQWHMHRRPGGRHVRQPAHHRLVQRGRRCPAVRPGHHDPGPGRRVQRRQHGPGRHRRQRPGRPRGHVRPGLHRDRRRLPGRHARRRGRERRGRPPADHVPGRGHHPRQRALHRRRPRAHVRPVRQLPDQGQRHRGERARAGLAGRVVRLHPQPRRRQRRDQRQRRRGGRRERHAGLDRGGHQHHRRQPGLHAQRPGRPATRAGRPTWSAASGSGSARASESGRRTAGAATAVPAAWGGHGIPWSAPSWRDAGRAEGRIARGVSPLPGRARAPRRSAPQHGQAASGPGPPPHAFRSHAWPMRAGQPPPGAVGPAGRRALRPLIASVPG